MKEEIADFIHDREHPYWETARRNEDFCTEIMLEVRAAQAIALATKAASEDDGDEDRALRAHAPQITKRQKGLTGFGNTAWKT